MYVIFEFDCILSITQMVECSATGIGALHAEEMEVILMKLFCRYMWRIWSYCECLWCVLFRHWEVRPVPLSTGNIWRCRGLQQFHRLYPVSGWWVLWDCGTDGAHRTVWSWILLPGVLWDINTEPRKSWEYLSSGELWNVENGHRFCVFSLSLLKAGQL